MAVIEWKPVTWQLYNDYLNNDESQNLDKTNQVTLKDNFVNISESTGFQGFRASPKLHSTHFIDRVESFDEMNRVNLSNESIRGKALVLICHEF